MLEIGTGYGCQGALLARLAAQVVSIEIWPGLAAQARRNLAAQAITNVRVVRHPHAAVESARPCARSLLS